MAATSRGHHLHCDPVQAVERFVIGREHLGEVQFLRPVNVLDVNLDSVIDIEKGRIQMYGLPNGPVRPPPGEGLNVPAMLTFR